MNIPPEDLLDKMSILQLKIEGTNSLELKKEYETYGKAIEEYKKAGIEIKDSWFYELYKSNKEQWDIYVNVGKKRGGRELEEISKEELIEIGRLGLAIEQSNRKRVAIRNEIVEKTGKGFKDIKMN